MRTRFALLGAALATVGAVVLLFAIPGVSDEADVADGEVAVAVVVVAALAALILFGGLVLAVYGLGSGPRWLVVTAIVLLAAAGLLAGAGALYLPLFATLAGGLALAAGDPLPPPDPDDDRLTRAFPRRED